MARANYGTIELDLGGTKYKLQPTLAAYEKIETRMGGLRQAIENCSNMSLDGLTFIIAAGAGVGQREQKKLKEAIFAEGTLNVLPQVTDFLMKLLNPSGKDSEDVEDTESGE